MWTVEIIHAKFVLQTPTFLAVLLTVFLLEVSGSAGRSVNRIVSAS